MKKKLKKNQTLINNFGVKTNLKYICDVQNKISNLRYVKVLCIVCGEEQIKQYASIMAGTITSCGKQKCKILNNNLKKKKYNIGDKITEHLTYIGEDIERTTSNHRYFKVKCDCGEIVSCRLDTIKNQCKKCLSQLKRKTITDSHKKTLIKYIYESYKKNALLRKYSFDLNLVDFENLIFSKCYYCGCDPSNRAIRNYKKIMYNGVDRKNNAIGYEYDNCVTCCGRCNIMKNKWSHDEFISHIKNIINNLKT
jgi:hypothetical protein